MEGEREGKWRGHGGGGSLYLNNYKLFMGKGWRLVLLTFGNPFTEEIAPITLQWECSTRARGCTSFSIGINHLKVFLQESISRSEGLASVSCSTILFPLMAPPTPSWALCFFILLGAIKYIALWKVNGYKTMYCNWRSPILLGQYFHPLENWRVLKYS